MFRETACEVLFERDADDTSVATIVLESLIKVCNIFAHVVAFYTCFILLLAGHPGCH